MKAPLNHTGATEGGISDTLGAIKRAFVEFLTLPTLVIIGFLLLYTTINQMRPVEIIETIHDHTLRARRQQLSLVRRTRRASLYSSGAASSLPVTTTRHGYVTFIDLDKIAVAIKKANNGAEVVLRVSVGSYVAFKDVIADIKSRTTGEAAALAEVVCDAVRLERQRDIDYDPAFGIEQLATIAWTTISTSKSDPEPGLLTIRSLRDLLARWSNAENKQSDEQVVPVVYEDNTLAELMNAFESLAVVSSESMQHQNFAEVVRTFALMFDRLPPEQQRRAEDLILRILSALGDHVLTAELDAALSNLVSTLDAARSDTASAVRAARDELERSIGKLNSRSTRVPEQGSL